MQKNLAARAASMQIWLQGIISKGTEHEGAVMSWTITKVNPK
jgi:hypothetical protein